MNIKYNINSSRFIVPWSSNYLSTYKRFYSPNTKASNIKSIYTNKLYFNHALILSYNINNYRVYRYNKTRAFSSTPSFLHSYLTINSKPENIIFKDDKAVLMFPPLKPFDWFIGNTRKDGSMIHPDINRYLLEFKDIHISLTKFIPKLEVGYYKFEWCFYIDSSGESNIKNILIPVYTPDPFNKNCLNEVFGTYGYTIFLTTIWFFNENKEDRELIHTNICDLITKRLRDILDDKLSKNIINLNKDTLLIISKSNKDEFLAKDIVNKNITIPGIPTSVIRLLYNHGGSSTIREYNHDFVTTTSVKGGSNIASISNLTTNTTSTRNALGLVNSPAATTNDVYKDKSCAHEGEMLAFDGGQSIKRLEKDFHGDASYSSWLPSINYIEDQLGYYYPGYKSREDKFISVKHKRIINRILNIKYLDTYQYVYTSYIYHIVDYEKSILLNSRLEPKDKTYRVLKWVCTDGVLPNQKTPGITSYTKKTQFHTSTRSYITNNFIVANNLLVTKLNQRSFSYTSLTYSMGVKDYSSSLISNKRVKMKNQKVKIWMDWNIFKYGLADQFIDTLFSINSNLKFDTLYNLYIKVRSENGYIMICDKQRGIKFSSIHDPAIEILFHDILDYISKTYEKYAWMDRFECDALLLDFWTVEVPEGLKISNLDSLKDVMPKKAVEFISRDFNVFGDVWTPIKGRILKVSAFADGNFNILDPFFYSHVFKDKFDKEIKRNNYNYIYNSFSKFYLVDFNGRYYVIVYDDIDGNTSRKRCFNINGSLITQVKDILSVDEGVVGYNPMFIRVYKNKTIHFNKKKEVVLVENSYNFPSIGSNNLKVGSNSSWLPNTKIGTLDLETYEVGDGAKCYAIGFYTYIGDGKTYYIDKDQDSVKLIHDCINELLRDKYKGILFYMHNLGGFDAPFIIKSLTKFNEETKEGYTNPYIMDEHKIITRDNNILRLVIKREIDGKVRSLKIVDSLALLPGSLRSLSKDYEVDVHKGYFPYNFVNKDTLFYVGNTPDIKYYNNILKEDYKELYKEVWSLKDECLIYLEKDLLSLYKVLEKVNKEFFFKFNTQMTESLTIAGLASKLYLEKYYDSNKSPLPLILKNNIWKDIHSAYYGGRVEVYNPRFPTPSNKPGDVLYYYDINSLYPAASLNPMPGLKCKYLQFTNQPDLNNLFGFFYCKVKTPANNYLGLLPYRTSKGNLLFPTGEWHGWYFSDRLKFALINGYEIEIIKGYNFEKTQNAFTKFVKNIYEIKSNPSNKTEKSLAKLILNSLIGRFGMYFLKSISKLVNKERHDILSYSRIMKNYIEIGDDLYLDTYIPGISKKVCEEFGVNFVELLNKEKLDENSDIKSYKSVSISTAAATLSYAGIHMDKIFLYILKNGGKIYYTDTDSIVTDLKLPQDFVDSKEIGKLKLEYIITEAFFIADKTYAIKTLEGKIVKRAKGINSDSLSFDDYEKMFNQVPINNTIRTSSYRSYAKGYVVIKDKNINLNTTTYSKRSKVYEKGVWTETKPIFINETLINQHISPDSGKG
jgi:DNA polymerase type B, organellar and viral